MLPHPCAVRLRMNGAPGFLFVGGDKTEGVGIVVTPGFLFVGGDKTEGVRIVVTPPMRGETAHEWGTRPTCLRGPMRPKAEALGYLEATTT